MYKYVLEEQPDDLPTEVSVLQEGQNKISKTNVVNYPTELYMSKIFSTPGKLFVLTLTATNLHTKEDESILTWNIMCATPIDPPDWTLEFPPHKRPGFRNLIFFSCCYRLFHSHFKKT